MAIVFLFSATFLCIPYLEKKKDCPHQKPLLHLTQEHKGSKSYSHMPLQGPPEDKTRQKCHNSGSIKTSHFTAAHQDTQFSLHPTPRADTRQDLGSPTEQDSECGYISQQPSFCCCLSPSPARLSCAALSAALHCPSTGQPVKAIVLTTTSEGSGVPRRAAAWSLSLWVTWAPNQVWYLWDPAWIHLACHTLPPIRRGSLPR